MDMQKEKLTLKSTAFIKNLDINPEVEPELKEELNGNKSLKFYIRITENIDKIFDSNLGLNLINKEFLNIYLTWIMPVDKGMHSDLFAQNKLELAVTNKTNVETYDIYINPTQKYFINLSLEISALKHYKKTLGTMIKEKIFNINEFFATAENDMYAAIRSIEYENLHSFLFNKDTSFVLCENKALVAQNKKDKALYVTSHFSIRCTYPHFLLNYFVLNKSKEKDKTLKINDAIFEQAKSEVITVVTEHLKKDKCYRK